MNISMFRKKKEHRKVERNSEPISRVYWSDDFLPETKEQKNNNTQHNNSTYDVVDWHLHTENS